jgi:hypothetical protein
VSHLGVYLHSSPTQSPLNPQIRGVQGSSECYLFGDDLLQGLMKVRISGAKVEGYLNGKLYLEGT